MVVAAVPGRTLPASRRAGVMALRAGSRRAMGGTRDTARFAFCARGCFVFAGFLAAFVFNLSAAAFGVLLRLRCTADVFVRLLPFPLRLAMFALHKNSRKHGIDAAISRCVMDHSERKLWPRVLQL